MFIMMETGTRLSLIAGFMREALCIGPTASSARKRTGRNSFVSTITIIYEEISLQGQPEHLYRSA